MQIAIVLYPGFTALDLIGPYESLRWLPDAEVRLIWHETGPVAADSRLLLIGATHTFAETPRPDVVLVPGGFTTQQHARDGVLLDWLRAAHEKATWTTSVCSGSVLLAASGLLKDRRATSHWAALPLLKAFGATPVGDGRIVEAGDRIVTAAGVSAGIDLGLWLAGRIGGDEAAKVIQLSLEYDPEPPYDSGHLSKATTRTKAAAALVMAKQVVGAGGVTQSGALLWETALRSVRARGSRT